MSNILVKIFPINGTYTICKSLEDGTMDPYYDAILDIKDRGEANYIVDRINAAYRQGKSDKAKEIRQALNRE
jgi:hypothetical protein